ncbi:serine/threonine-protein kinase [Streptomyces sp. CT34]|uniref:serine/threonine-protein kinase n=1 Tax=Streptomyces sp. CT34 TaxID=1553907 RepID=UPI0005BD9223|nr:serine/threonine-protein kinase [Streptomyces sp. CT34]
MEGRLIGGRYRLGIRLGRGGMGTVWRATDQLLDRQVAVKELHLDDGAAEPEARAQRDRAMREARTVAQVKHPNVIVVHDVVEQDGRPWIVMELVEGPSLADRLAGGGPLAPREAARIGIALLGALRAAHTRGVLHRDIKPANVLMENGTGRVVLTDFGVAQVPGVTTLTDTNGFVGSPEYTAPERMSGRGAGPEADLWSLGVLLCAVLSGETPFRRDSMAGVLHAVVYDEIELPEEARPLRAVVGGLLERDPRRRLDVAETARLLRGYLRSGRAPERGGRGGHRGFGPGTGPGAGRGTGPGGGSAGEGAAGPAAAAAAGPAPPPGPGAPRDPFDDGPGGGRPSEHPPSEDPFRPVGEDPVRPGSTPVPPTPEDAAPPATTRPGRAAPDRPPAGRIPGRRTPGVPIPAALDDRALAAAARPHTGRTRRALLIAGAVVVVAGVAAGVVALVANGSGDDSGPHPGGSAQATGRKGATGPAATPDAAPSKPGPPVTGTTVPSSGEDGTLPAGYRMVQDPDGFALAVPVGFTRSYENSRVYYSSEGKRFRIGVRLRTTVPEGPLGALRTADANGPADYPGYRDGQVTETTHNGFRAGLWEFVRDGSARDAGARCTYDLSWNEDGKMMDVWISAPIASRIEAERHFDTAVAAFRLSDR